MAVTVVSDQTVCSLTYPHMQLFWPQRTSSSRSCGLMPVAFVQSRRIRPRDIGRVFQRSFM
jgi:hypothetical protein